MASEPAATPFPVGRLVGVGLIVFLANAALLVLQLVAGRLLAPFVGSSLETWTSVIGVFLTGIALGNALGGKLADRYPSPRTLAILLAVGALAALWMVLFPMLIAGGAYKAIPLGPRIPLLALVLCLPAGFVLSLLTPLAIKLGLPDVSKTGRVAGLVFALSTLGCLLGNYLTGFVLMKTFTINTLVFISAGSLAALALWTLVALKPGEPGADLASLTPLRGDPRERPEQATPVADAPGSPAHAPGSPGHAPGSPGTSPHPVADAPGSPNPHAFTDIRIAYLIVFLASFGGMTLELTASRVLAQYLGVSLFTWTGIIGVMLAGTALGNLTGGLVADRVNRPGSAVNPRSVLAGTLIVAAAGTVFVLLLMWYFSNYIFGHRGSPFAAMSPIRQVVVSTFSLFFLPMYLLGMISPQVIRLAVPDVAHVGRVAGRVYAWSTTGAIVGTFAAGYVLLSTLGMKNTLLAVALVLALTSLLVARVWNENLMLYLFSLVLGGVVGGFILNFRTGREQDVIAHYESNYYTITVSWEREPRLDASGREEVDEDGNVLYFRTGRLSLTLDHLVHSTVDPEDPGYLHYSHEHIQMEFLRGARAANPNPRVLVIGGGGYTFPRYAMEQLPETRLDVVEIDPGVTKVAREYLGLKDYEGMTVVHMDGRQFVAEKAGPGTYDLVIQDAVNDLSVPSHLMTREYNEAVKRALKPGSVYLLTVIDNVTFGELWKAGMHTLRETYPADNVCLLVPNVVDVRPQQVLVIYASDKPLDLASLQKHVRQHSVGERGFAAGLAARTAVGGGAAGAAPGGSHHALAAVAAADAVFELILDRTAPFRTRRVPEETIRPYLEAGKKIILTDQFAPVDNLMAEVFRKRKQKPPPEKE